ncbi:MAG: hypothetical protein KDB88_01365 [Flavobacteriales bacterium]|nr:hypothetical protein [Flavobacteriales bacterium]
MVLLDAVHEASEEVQITELTVREGELFVEEGRLLEGGMIEHVAQSAAAGIGVASASSGSGTPPIGFIGGISRLRIHELPRIGTTLHTTIRVQHSMEGVRLVHGTVRSGGTVLGEMELKVFIMSDPQ